MAMATVTPSSVIDGVFHVRPRVFGDDRGNHWAQGAARWHVVPETLLLDASLGRQTAGGRTARLTVGLKWMF